MATSPRKSPTPKRSIGSGSTRPRKSVSSSTKGKSRIETPDKSTRETEKQTKTKKSTDRKSIKVVDPGGNTTQGAMPVTTSWISLCAYPIFVALSEQEPSRRSVSKVTANIVEGGPNILGWCST